jgi:hypothetical protein
MASRHDALDAHASLAHEISDLLRVELSRYVVKHAAGFHDGLHLPVFASYIKPVFALFLCNA